MKKQTYLFTLVVSISMFINCSSLNDPIDENDDTKYWLKATSPVTDNLTDIFFVNENVGWAVGNNSAIIKTTDGGKTWTKQIYSSFANFNDVFFLNENIGWSAGTAGTLIHTSNGGTTWTKLPIVSINGTYWSLTEVHFIDEKVGWIVGNSNGGVADVVIKTEDGGTTWTAKLDKIPTQLNAINVVSPSKIYVAGGGFKSAAKLFYTANAGQSWTETTIGSEEYSVSSIGVHNTTIYLVCPYANSGYISDDLGINWYKNDDFLYSSKVIIDDGIVWSSGSNQKYSTDWGTNWTITTEKNSGSVNNGDWLNCFYAIGNKAWAATDNGAVFYYK